LYLKGSSKNHFKAFCPKIILFSSKELILKLTLFSSSNNFIVNLIFSFLSKDFSEIFKISIKKFLSIKELEIEGFIYDKYLYFFSL
jgi:hypothetical protein